MSADKKSIAMGDWDTAGQEARYGPFLNNWVVLPAATAKLSITKQPGAGFYNGIAVQRRKANGEWTVQYSVPTGTGTSEINVVPETTYRIAVTYWACQTINCATQSLSNSFTISSGQTRKISIVGGTVTSIQ